MTKRRAQTREQTVIAALDIGRSKVSCVVASLQPVNGSRVEPEILGVGQYGLPIGEGRHLSGALDDGGLSVENAVRAAIEAGERMAGVRVRDAYVAVSGRVDTCAPPRR